MEKIYKYAISIDDIQTIQLPKDSVILTVQNQFERPFVWVLHDLEKEREEFILEIFGTGHPIEPINLDKYNGRRYIGTFQMGGGSLIWHVFQLRTKDQ